MFHSDCFSFLSQVGSKVLTESKCRIWGARGFRKGRRYEMINLVSRKVNRGGNVGDSPPETDDHEFKIGPSLHVSLQPLWMAQEQVVKELHVTWTVVCQLKWMKWEKGARKLMVSTRWEADYGQEMEWEAWWDRMKSGSTFVKSGWFLLKVLPNLFFPLTSLDFCWHVLPASDAYLVLFSLKHSSSPDKFVSPPELKSHWKQELFIFCVPPGA